MSLHAWAPGMLGGCAVCGGDRDYARHAAPSKKLKPDGWHTYHVCGGQLREIVQVAPGTMMCEVCGEWYYAGATEESVQP